MFTRYRSPLRWSSRLMAISGAVCTFLTRLIRADLAAEGGTGCGTTLTVPVVSVGRAMFNVTGNDMNVILCGRGGACEAY